VCIRENFLARKNFTGCGSEGVKNMLESDNMKALDPQQTKPKMLYPLPLQRWQKKEQASERASERERDDVAITSPTRSIFCSAGTVAKSLGTVKVTGSTSRYNQLL